MDPTDPNILAALNASRGGFNETMGFTFVEASRDRVVASFRVGPQHLQPYGIVHGGVHAAVIETLCSTGAAIDAMARGQSVVGLENQTSFVRAVREGVLRATATPLTRGRKSQLWEGRVEDESGRLVAIGRVRLLALEAGEAIAGKTAGIEGAPDALAPAGRDPKPGA